MSPTGLRVLVIAPQPVFTPRGTPLSVYYRALVMAEKGAQIDLLTYGDGADVDIASVRHIRIPRVPGMGRVPVGPSWRKLVLDFFMVWWTIGLLLRYRHKVVHAHEEAVFWCRFLSPLFGFRLIYDMHSSLPQQLENFKFTKSRILKSIFRWLEDGALRKADAVITICPDLQTYALHVGVSETKHLLIENSIFDDVHLKPSATSGVAQVQGADPLQDIDFRRPTVVYAGTFEAYQGIELLVRAFRLVLDALPNAQLVLAGGTPEQIGAIRTLCTDLRLGSSCILTGRVSKADAMFLTRQTTVLVSPRLYGTNTPLKIYEQLASGKPLVATSIWSHTQVLTAEVCVLVEPVPDDLAKGLLKLLLDPALRDTLAARARALYERAYSRPVYERKIQRLLELVS